MPVNDSIPAGSTPSMTTASPSITTPTRSTLSSLSSSSITTEFYVNETSFAPWTTESFPNTNESCPNGMRWLRDRFGDCVETPAQVFAFSAGMIAIGFWFIAHFMIFKAYREDPDCSFTRLALIILAILGSVSNLVGAVLCDQLGTQILTACCLLLADIIFLGQWLRWWNRNRKLNKQGLSFYVSSDDWKSPGRTREENALNGGPVGGALVLCVCLPCSVTLFYFSLPWQDSYNAHGSLSTGRKLLMVSDSAVDNFGYVLGFVAMMLYTFCKIPTMINIMKHKILFKESLVSHVLLILANVFYVTSILAFDQSSEFLVNAIPWILTSFALLGTSCIIICLVMRNRGIGTNTRPVGRRRPDGTFLLYPSEESLNSDLERVGTLRFTDDAGSVKLPSIKEEPQLEGDRGEMEAAADDINDDYDDIHDDYDDDLDAETASIHSRASDFILDDDEDLFVRNQQDGLEWDFDDFRPKYSGGNDDGLAAAAAPGSPNHHSFGIPGDEDEWDEDRVLDEIEKELQLGDEYDGDTVSMEYDTAEDEDQFYQGGFASGSHSM